jgi:hypothetical protein
MIERINAGERSGIVPNYICTACGVQYPVSSEPPEVCHICNEERQYVNPNRQSWTTLEQMQSGGYDNEILQEEHHLYSITTKPSFAIGQTAYLVQTPGFHILWDCLTYLDNKTLETIQGFGGVNAIALSHPHYYGTQVTWAEKLDVPIYIHEDDRQWVMEMSPQIEFWSGEVLELTDGLTLHRLGGHFKGGTVLHWTSGNGGRGALLSGDIIQVVADKNWVSFMYSYPNLIPLPAAKVADIAGRVSQLQFNRLYNAFHRIVPENAYESVQKSAQRYIDALEGRLFST